MKILWIVPKFPLGAPDGARYATCALIRHLVPLGAAIDLLCLLPEGELADASVAMKNLGVLSCTLLRRSGSRYWPLPSPRAPITFKSFTSSGLRRAFQRELTRWVETLPPVMSPWLVFVGLHSFGALSDETRSALVKRGCKMAYRAHNFETSFWEQCAAKSPTPWFRWFFLYQATLVRTFERRITQSVDVTAPVSDEDKRRFEILVPGARIFTVPIGMDFPDENKIPPIPDSAKFELLFIGRLDWLPNRNGLLWFLENVWPALTKARPDTALTIAGTGDGRWLEKFQKQPGIRCLGRVDDIAPLYASSALAIAPLFQGSGTRVKIIEAACYGRPVMSTALGAEGSGLVPGQSYYQAESPTAWIDRLSKVGLSECRQTGLAAYRKSRDRFDGRAIAKQFVQELAGV